jgi:hypothetical protein
VEARYRQRRQRIEQLAASCRRLAGSPRPPHSAALELFLQSWSSPKHALSLTKYPQYYLHLMLDICQFSL